MWGQYELFDWSYRHFHTWVIILKQLIISQVRAIDSFGQLKVTTGRDHCFRTCLSVSPSPLFKSRKTKQQKTTFTTGVTMGLAEWIIDDSCLACIGSSTLKYKCVRETFFSSLRDPFFPCNKSNSKHFGQG